MDNRYWVASGMALALAAAGVGVTATTLETSARMEPPSATAESSMTKAGSLANDAAARALAQVPVFARPRLGVSTRDVTAEEARAAGLDGPTGAYVTKVTPDSPAAKAGLAEEDIVIALDGEAIRSARQLARVVSETAAGRSVQIGYVRGTSRHTTTAELPESSSLTRSLPRFEWDGDGLSGMFAFPDGSRAFSITRGPRRGRLGLTGQALSGQLAEYFGVKSGVLVTDVLVDSPAARAGLKAGDVVTAIDGRAVDDVGDIVSAIGGKDGEQTLTLSITRDRRNESLTVTLPPVTNSSREKSVVVRPRVTV